MALVFVEDRVIRIIGFTLGVIRIIGYIRRIGFTLIVCRLELVVALPNLFVFTMPATKKTVASVPSFLVFVAYKPKYL